MDEEDLMKSTDWQTDDPPRSRLNPYTILMRQSRLMGRVATRTYDVTKEFLKRDVSSLPTPIRAGGKFETVKKYKELIDRGLSKDA